MKVEICTSYDAHSSGDQEKSPSTGLTSSATPETETPQKEENQQVGVSTHYTLSETKRKPENSIQRLIGMHSEPPTEERRRHTTIW